MSIEQIEMSTAEINNDAAYFNAFAVLGGDVLRDGNMFGAVIGDLPTGCAAFQKTRAAAVLQCMNAYYNEIAKVPGKPTTKQ